MTVRRLPAVTLPAASRASATLAVLATLGLSLAALTRPPAVAAQASATSRRASPGMVGELRRLHRLDLLPLYRTGSRVAQISSYDTTGGNDDGFDGTYSSIRREGKNRVLADLQGPGVVQRIWTPTPTTTMVAFYFDGEATPRLRLPFIDLFSGKAPPFVKPVVGNEVGGYVSYLPIPYARSLKIVYEGEDIRFHQIQYRRYPAGTRIESFHTPLSAAASAQLDSVVALWSAPGRRPFAVGGTEGTAETGGTEGTAETGGTAGMNGSGAVHATRARFTLAPGDSVTLYRADRGGRIVGITLERDGVGAWGRGFLFQARWDGDEALAIDAPVDDFFGYAFGKPSAKGLLLGSEGGRDYAWLPMPFGRSAQVTLRALAGVGHAVSGTATVYWTTEPVDPDTEGRFYAAWRRESDPPSGQPYLILDAAGRGHDVATLLQAQGLRPGMTTFFEGDDVATIDGAMRLHGTGSEDSFNGGWYALLDRWDRAVPLPMYGALDYNLPMSRTGGYRFYLGDALSFEKHLRLTIEHGPEGNDVPVDYTSLAPYYGDAPSASAMDPARSLAPARVPATHVFYPQLLSVSLGSGTSLAYHQGFLEMHAEGDGFLRIDVSDVPAGRYRVRLSYRNGPDEGTFSVWRRQAQVSPWIDARADTLERVDSAVVGEVELTPQVRSLTIRTRAQDGRGTFRFDRVILDDLARREDGTGPGATGR